MPDENEPNDSAGAATPITNGKHEQGFFTPCSQSKASTGAADGVSDDWFSAVGVPGPSTCPLTPTPTVRVEGGGAAEVCLYLRPTAGDGGEASCPAGLSPDGATVAGAVGCCSQQGEARVTFTGRSAEMFVRVRPAAGATDACFRYTLKFNY